MDDSKYDIGAACGCGHVGLAPAIAFAGRGPDVGVHEIDEPAERIGEEGRGDHPSRRAADTPDSDDVKERVDDAGEARPLPGSGAGTSHSKAHDGGIQRVAGGGT